MVPKRRIGWRAVVVAATSGLVAITLNIASNHIDVWLGDHGGELGKALSAVISWDWTPYAGFLVLLLTLYGWSQVAPVPLQVAAVETQAPTNMGAKAIEEVRENVRWVKVPDQRIAATCPNDKTPLMFWRHEEFPVARNPPEPLYAKQRVDPNTYWRGAGSLYCPTERREFYFRTPRTVEETVQEVANVILGKQARGET